MRYGQRDLDGYMDGNVFGQFQTESMKKALIIDGVAGLVSFGLAALEGAQVTEEVQKDAAGKPVLDAAGKQIKTGVKTYGSEVKIGGKIPLNIVIAAGLHAAAAFDVGDSLGVDPDYINSAAAAAVSVWTTNRGHAMGLDWRKKKEAAAAKTATPAGAPRTLRDRTQVATGGQVAATSPWQR